MPHAKTYEFEITKQAPEIRRHGGPGRKRENPFDAIVLQSYEERWADQVSGEAPNGLWAKLTEKVDTKEEYQRVEAKIRSAGAYWKEKDGLPIRTNVRWDPETGELFFRGVAKRDVDSTSDEADSRDEDSDQGP